MLLFLLFQRYIYDLHLGDYERIDKELSPDDSLIINANDPLMSVNVIQANFFNITQTLNGYLYKSYVNAENITFFDFGGFTGNLQFTAATKSRLILEVFLFPNECNIARMVTDTLPYIFELTKTNTNPYFRMGNDQIFCLWHISQGPKNVSISMMTEKFQDTFKQMKERTDILTLSGNEQRTLTLNTTEYWFKWRSDDQDISDYLSVQFTNDLFDPNNSRPFVEFFSVSTNYSKAVMLSKGNVYEIFVDQSSEYGPGEKSWVTIVCIVVVVVVIIIALIITAVCFYKRCYHGKFEFRSPNHQDAQELLDDFTLCNSSDVLPQPISYNVVFV